MPFNAAKSPQSPNLMEYPSASESERARIAAHLAVTAAVPKETRRCLVNLLAYRAVRTRAQLPRGASAAVLVPLFVGRSGDVYVLLSRRSDALRTFAGDTVLPGGRIDAQDETVEDAARREAFEEIGLPRDKERVPLLCVMEPHLARGEIIVTPIVVLILDHSLQPNLNASEVTSIFARPLITFLSSTLPPRHRSSGGRTAGPDGPHHTFTDVSWGGGDGVLRLHRFLTGCESEGVKPVFGVTASILIKAATIGYGRPPDFQVQPPNAPTSWQQIARALLTSGNPLRVGCEREGIDANEVAARLLSLPRPLPVPVAADVVRTIGAERIVDHAWGGADGPGATIEGLGCGKQARERRSRQAASPGLDELSSLDVTRAMKERIEETRKEYPDIAARVKEGLKRSVEAGEEGMVDTKCRARDDDGVTRERDMDKGRESVGRSLEGTNDDSEQAILSKKRSTKL